MPRSKKLKVKLTKGRLNVMRSIEVKGSTQREITTRSKRDVTGVNHTLHILKKSGFVDRIEMNTKTRKGEYEPRRGTRFIWVVTKKGRKRLRKLRREER